MRSPLVSVIIPCYNQGRFLAEAIESALGQTYPNVEVIVVNDGSTDDTAEVAANYKEQIIYLEQDNKGLPAARNAGIKIASGDFIATLDSDDTWMPHKLEMQMPLFHDHSVALVGSAYHSFNSETSQIIRTFHVQAEATYHDFMEANRIGVLTAVFPRHICEQVGLFDECLNACEDWDLWIRITVHHMCRNINIPLAKYRIHSSNMSYDDERMLQARLKVLWKNRHAHQNCSKCISSYRKGVDYAWSLYYQPIIEEMKMEGLFSPSSWHRFIKRLRGRRLHFCMWYYRRRIRWISRKLVKL